jgi:predicted ribosomally synthesized peptide with nif11-like leader
MSLEAAKALIEKMKTDEAFAKKVMSVEDVTERVALINAEGFDCTAEEIKAVQSELSDDELDDIAGGWCLIKFGCDSKGKCNGLVNA